MEQSAGRAHAPGQAVCGLWPAQSATAQLAQLPVNSFYLLPERARMMRSWDALLVPKPFSRVVMVWGRPVPPPESSEMEVQARFAVEATLERLRGLAERHFSKNNASWQ